MMLDEALFNSITVLYVEIRLVIANASDRHLLRAMLYETLMPLQNGTRASGTRREAIRYFFNALHNKLRGVSLLVCCKTFMV